MPQSSLRSISNDYARLNGSDYDRRAMQRVLARIKSRRARDPRSSRSSNRDRPTAIAIEEINSVANTDFRSLRRR